MNEEYNENEAAKTSFIDDKEVNIDYKITEPRLDRNNSILTDTF